MEVKITIIRQQESGKSLWDIAHNLGPALQQSLPF